VRGILVMGVWGSERPTTGVVSFRGMPRLRAFAREGIHESPAAPKKKRESERLKAG